MVGNWTILPEFDENHQNRYIVMVSSREEAENLIKKFPDFCSHPFELTGEKYKWGLYVDNSTREERKNIYKFFLGEIDAADELNKEDEIKEVITELHNVFSALTTAEQRHLKQEIPEKIESIERFPEKTSRLVLSPAPVSAPQREKKPEVKPEPAPDISDAKKEISAPAKIEIERFGEPAHLPDVKVVVADLSADVSVQKTPAAAIPPVQKPPAKESIRVGYLYPFGATEQLEKFTNQIKTMTEKTMRTPIYLEKTSATEYSTTATNDFNAMVKNAKLKSAEIILAIVPDGLSDINLFIDTACRGNEILYMIAQQSQLDKKFLFVDMAIEILLIKKKLR